MLSEGRAPTGSIADSVIDHADVDLHITSSHRGFESLLSRAVKAQLRASGICKPAWAICASGAQDLCIEA